MARCCLSRPTQRMRNPHKKTIIVLHSHYLSGLKTNNDNFALKFLAFVVMLSSSNSQVFSLYELAQEDFSTAMSAVQVLYFFSPDWTTCLDSQGSEQRTPAEADSKGKCLFV